MKTTIHLKDLTKKDGFPPDIDRTKTVAVQICKASNKDLNIIIYQNKSGMQSQHFLSHELSDKYAEGIYIINK